MQQEGGAKRELRPPPHPDFPWYCYVEMESQDDYRKGRVEMTGQVSGIEVSPHKVYLTSQGAIVFPSG